VDWTTILLSTGTAGLLLAFLVYRRATNEASRAQDMERPRRTVRRPRPEDQEERREAQPQAAPVEAVRPTRQSAVQGNVRLLMQVLITFFGVAFGVMVVLDGCYGWLGWCQEPATEGAKNWASGIVGTVFGFWLTKA